MDRGKFPSWLLFAVVVGLGELSDWLYNHYGFGVVTKTALLLTFLTAVACVALVIVRSFLRKRQLSHRKEKLENMTD